MLQLEIDFVVTQADNEMGGPPMTIQLELSPETEARLTAAAHARGIAPEQYAGVLLEDVLPVVGGTGRLTVEELRTMLREIAEGSERLPTLPTSSFTRESFYEDRY